VELLYRTSIPDNITNWRVFDDDQQIINFLHLEDNFRDFVIDEGQHDQEMTLLHIVKIPTFYLRRYGQNCPYCRKIEEIYKKKFMLPDNVALATLTSVLPR
jgi:hypothetical protein